VAGDADLILDVGPRSNFEPRSIKHHLQMIQSLLKNRFKRMLNL